MSKTMSPAKTKPTGPTGNGTPAAQTWASGPYSATAPMATAEDRPLIYVNGQIVPKSQAMISVYDHGLLYGDGVFEGIRIYNGKIFKCQQHMDRLYRLRREDPPARSPSPSEEMIQVQRDCIAANDLRDGYIRLVVTRGYGTLGLDPRRCPTPASSASPTRSASTRPRSTRRAWGSSSASRPKTPIACLDPRIKSLNYLNNILAKIEAIDAGLRRSHHAQPRGLRHRVHRRQHLHRQEGQVSHRRPSSARHARRHHPPLRHETRCASCGIPPSRSCLRLDEVLSADEVFLTGTAAEVIAVTQIDHTDGKRYTISDGEGPLTRAIANASARIVTSDHVPED